MKALLPDFSDSIISEACHYVSNALNNESQKVLGELKRSRKQVPISTKVSREQDITVPKLVTTANDDLENQIHNDLSDSLVNLCLTQNEPIDNCENDVTNATDSENLDTSLTALTEAVQTSQNMEISHCIDKSGDCGRLTFAKIE